MKYCSCGVDLYVFKENIVSSLNNSECIAMYQYFFDNNMINVLFWKINFLVEFEWTSTTNFMVQDQVAVSIFISFIQNQNFFTS